MSVDVCVIGGGPAGCVAAAHLAAAGIRVLMLEEHSVIGQPVDCSGIIGTEAFDNLPLPRETIRDELRCLELVSPSGKRLLFDPGRTLAYVVDRAAFDHALGVRAVSAGVECWLSASATGLDVTPNGVDIAVIREGVRVRVRALAVVLASGPRYRFQEQLGMGRPAKYLKTVQAVLDGADEGLPQVYVGSTIASGSFAWRLPLAGASVTKIGVSATAESRVAFGAFTQLLRRQGGLPRISAARAWMIPISPLPRTYADRAVAVGDAAGQTKPTTGGGLYYGLLCARLAAETLLEGLAAGDLSAKFLSRYERQWRRVLGREIATAHRFRALYELLTDVEIEGLFDLMGEEGMLGFLEREADFDWHRQIILQTIRRPSLARILLRTQRAALSGMLG